MTEELVAITVPRSIAMAFTDAIEDLHARSIGELPEVIYDLESKLLEHERRYPHLFDANGNQIQATAPVMTPEQDAELTAAYEELFAEDGALERARFERFVAFREQAQPETDQLFHDWLEEYAATFWHAREQHHQDRKDALRAAFKAREGRA